MNTISPLYAIIDHKRKEKETRAIIRQLKFYTNKLEKHNKREPKNTDVRQRLELILLNRYNLLLTLRPFINQTQFLSPEFKERYFKAKHTAEKILNL